MALGISPRIETETAQRQNGRVTERMVLITAPSREVGGDLARRMVEAKLAACVNLVNGVESFFWWEGAVQSESEVLLIAKTDQEKVVELRDRVIEWHPYDTPEFIVFEIADGSAPYLNWIRESVGVS